MRTMLYETCGSPSVDSDSFEPFHLKDQYRIQFNTTKDKLRLQFIFYYYKQN